MGLTYPKVLSIEDVAPYASESPTKGWPVAFIRNSKSDEQYLGVVKDIKPVIDGDRFKGFNITFLRIARVKFVNLFPVPFVDFGKKMLPIEGSIWLNREMFIDTDPHNQHVKLAVNASLLHINVGPEQIQLSNIEKDRQTVLRFLYPVT